MLSSITSVEREFRALSKFAQIHPCIRQTLLKPHEQTLAPTKMFIIPTALDQALSSLYNSSQYQAILASLKQEGVTLVQGPPGTGKTKTVLGTLSVLLQSSTSREQDEELPLLLRWKTSEQNLKNNPLDLNPWLSPAYQDWRDQPMLGD